MADTIPHWMRLSILAICRAQHTSKSDNDHERCWRRQVCDQTKQWVEEVIVGYNICPFAKKTVVDNTVRYVVSDATNSDDLVSDSWREAALLLDTDPEEIATTLVMAPKFAGDIDEYAGMGYWMEDYLEDEDEPIFEQAVRLLSCPGSPNAHAHARMHTLTHQHTMYTQKDPQIYSIV
jgi:hypothetical protein